MASRWTGAGKPRRPRMEIEQLLAMIWEIICEMEGD